MGASDSLIQKFLSSAGDRLTAFGEALGTLRSAADTDEVVKRLARDLHTYKGESRLLGLDEIERLTHAAEDMLFSHHQAKRISDETEMLLFEAIDLIFVCVQSRLDGLDLPSSEIDELVDRLRGAVLAQSNDAPSRPEPKRSRAPEPREVVAEEAAPKSESPSTSRTPEGRTPEGRTPTGRRVLQVELDRLDSITDLVSNVAGALVRNRQLLATLQETTRELREYISSTDEDLSDDASRVNLTTDTQLNGLVEMLSESLREFREHHFRLDLSYSELAEDVRESRLQPLRTIFVHYAPFVRSVARREGKEIELEITGDGIGVDQQVLDRIAEPGMHLLRNAIVHGIETAEERREAGKSPTGTIRISARQDGEFIRLEFADDGRGIDVERVRRRALNLGLIDDAHAERFSLADATDLIFTSGLSTAVTADELAGRGVGLDVVASVVESTGGALSVESIPGKGSKFVIVVPLSLSLTRALLFQASDQLFAVPSSAVVEMFRLSVREIRSVEGRETCEYRGQILPLVRLREALGLRGIRDIFVNKVGVIVLRAGTNQTGFVVDNFIGERELVVRPFGAFIGRPPMASGVTPLEDGTVVVMLHAGDLLRSAESGDHRRVRVQTARVSGEERRILYAEDSVITRDYTAGVLRSRGYDVTEVSDGQEAWERMNTEPFDLLLTDIQMPRLDGFKLCARIRASEAHKNLPIVVMSTLDTPEPKRMAMDAGADAYLVKSAFAADVLVATIEQVAR